MNETISIRRFRDSDAEPVSRLIVDALLTCCGPDYPPEPLGAFARSQTPACMRERGRTTHFYVAEEDGTPVGCAAVGRDPEGPGVCGVYSFYVLPTKQGRGIGRRLMEALEADPWGREARLLTLHASLTALGFYRRMGFGFRDGCTQPDRDGLYMMEKAR